MGFAIVLGTTLCTEAISTKKAAQIAGLLISLWPPLHFLSLLFGNDAFSIGLSCIGIGLLYYGVHLSNKKGVLMAMIGCALLPISIWAKEISAPTFFLLPLLILLINKRNIWMSPFVLYTSYWSYAWFWPHRNLPDIIQKWDIVDGWMQLYDLSTYRMNEGKILQLLLLSFVGWVCTIKTKKHTLLLISTLLGVSFTCGFLGVKLRPRYLIAFGLPICALLGISISNTRFRSPFVFLGCSLFFIDTWSHQSVLSTNRHKWMGTNQSSIPAPPKIWTQQYNPIPERLLRDISLIGAKKLVLSIKQGEKVATIPLRDERHRSILAYANIYGGTAMIITPQKCCTKLDETCAHRVKNELNQAGYTLFLPIESAHSPRWDSSINQWYKLLQQQVSSDVQSDQYWTWDNPTSQGGHTPCQKVPAP